MPGDYPDRRDRDGRLLVYETPPLDEDLAIAGHPLATLFAARSDPGAARVFAYLEDVAPDGRVAYVTEGQLAGIHRAIATGPAVPASPAPGRTFRRRDALPVEAGAFIEMAVDLLPIAWRFRRGHSVRLALACADADHFAPPAGGGSLSVAWGGARKSRLELPVLP